MNHDDGSASSSRMRNRRQDDAKLARSIAAARIASQSSSEAGRRSSRHGRDRRSAGRSMMGSSSSSASSSGSRLRFLLSILLITTLLLVLLQAFRHVRSGSQSKLRGRMVRARAALLQNAARAGQDGATPGSWTDRVSIAIAAAAAPDSVPSSSVAAEQRRKYAEEQDAPKPDWRSYIAAMRQHFDDTVGRVKPPSDSVDETRGAREASNTQMGARVSRGGGGMAVVPGEGVRDWSPTSGSAIGETVLKKPAPVPGKSEEEAEQDRRVALEDLDQETIKALFDALYGRGG